MREALGQQILKDLSYHMLTMLILALVIGIVRDITVT